MKAHLLHPGRGTGWWWPGLPVVADGRRIWVGDRPFPLPDVVQVVPTGDVLRVELLDGRLAEIRGARWRFLRKAPSLPRLWRSDGFLYVEDDRGVRAIDVIGKAERLLTGPRGETLIGADTLVRGAAPGRTPQRLGAPIVASTVRWGDGVVAGVDPDGHGVVVDLRTFRATRRDGVPVEADAWLDEGVIRRGDEVLATGVLEASPARWGDDLAGPGGVVWDLRTGTRRFDTPAIALGATVGTPDGFVTIDWRSHRGWTVDPATGARSREFVLPLGEEDTVSGAVWADGAVHVESALGERLKIVAGTVSAGDRSVEPEDEDEIDTPAGPFTGRSDTVGDVHYAWNEDGWLLAW